MSHPVPRPPSGFPRAPLVALAALVAATVVGVAAVRLTGVGLERTPLAPAQSVRQLVFQDRADGSIEVVDAASGRRVQTVAPGGDGFLRGTMRGMARERKRQGVGAELPFHLVGHTDGRLTLDDPGTGRRVDLGSFGPTNAAVFARLLTAPRS